MLWPGIPNYFLPITLKKSKHVLNIFEIDILIILSSLIYTNTQIVRVI